MLHKQCLHFWGDWICSIGPGWRIWFVSNPLSNLHNHNLLCFLGRLFCEWQSKCQSHYDCEARRLWVCFAYKAALHSFNFFFPNDTVYVVNRQPYLQAECSRSQKYGLRLMAASLNVYYSRGAQGLGLIPITLRDFFALRGYCYYY